jgi:hypothetical protein
MRIAINEKTICNKEWMDSGTNVNKLCIGRAFEGFGGSASYMQIKEGRLPFLS